MTTTTPIPTMASIAQNVTELSLRKINLERKKTKKIQEIEEEKKVERKIIIEKKQGQIENIQEKLKELEDKRDLFLKEIEAKIAKKQEEKKKIEDLLEKEIEAKNTEIENEKILKFDNKIVEIEAKIEQELSEIDGIETI